MFFLLLLNYNNANDKGYHLHYDLLIQKKKRSIAFGSQ